jgi:F420 biosynthesis protein FbiB-like protein
METREAIAARRSIRRFEDRPVPEEVVNSVLTAAIQAPSGKNRQPWRFVVVAGEEKRAAMIRCMRSGIEQAREHHIETGSALWTTRIMRKAPVTIFVFNPMGMHPWAAHSTYEMYLSTVDVQSIGAAIQNMLLAAQDAGLGSLWICDVFSAYEQLTEWLGEPGQLIAAVALGYPAEHPEARPRHPLSDVVRWY